MPIFFLIIGVLLTFVAVNDRVGDLGELVKDDFSLSAKPNFIAWIIAISVVGSLGYAKAFKPVANAFLVLIILVMFLSNGAFFDKFTTALKGNN